ncbi:hypothetical protein JI750_03465 [Flavobacterium sp. GN10]|uniref:Uncharacterized protein n=1 Tax=Flavobacterium tagetis TaxID=2801336 RepID=A0ABS1K9G9_9FLAO|nr:hypothetical protein [Flavobacterium tagetis]MBL0735928.1 hypothetical protein [Flavobacterium tagetis]
MRYSVEIIFGKDQIRKYNNNEAFNDFEKTVNFKKYTFETQVQRNSFYKGMSETIGWMEFEVVKEFEENDQIGIEKKEEDRFDYWSFIQKFYPKYHQCNSVLLSEILTKKLDGEEISQEDEEYIRDWDVRNELLEIDKELLCKAFENYFTIMYPEK